MANILYPNDKAGFASVRRANKQAMINATQEIAVMVENASVVNATVNLDLTVTVARSM